MPRVSLTVDGTRYVDEVQPRTLLVQYLREQLGKVGTVIGCDTGNCGACTVLIDGVPHYSCSVLTHTVRARQVLTIEGLAAPNGTLHPVQQAFHEQHALQCGFCTPGMVMAAVDLLRENPHPTEAEIREGMSGNLCRCTGYQNIVRAVQAASTGNVGGAPASTAVPASAAEVAG